MAIDGAVIDTDHRHLVDIVNSFARHRSQGRAVTEAMDCLRSLKFYAETHFAREERLQRLVNYPQHAEQRREHQQMTKAVDEMIWKVERALDNDDVARVADELALLLRRWLLNHIIVHDLGMKPYAVALRSRARDLPPLKSIRRPAES
jgi:hemerythrin-like metal-binding protein